MTQPERDADYSSKSRLRRVMTTVLVAFLLLIGYFLTQSYFKSLAEAENASLMRLNGIVYTLAMQIDGDAHERLMTIHTAKDAITSPKQDQDYFAIHQVLRRNVQANMLNTAIYTIVLDSSTPAILV